MAKLISKYNSTSVFLLLAASLTYSPGASALMPIFSPDYYLGKSFEWVLAISSQFGKTEYIQVLDPVAEKRVRKSMASIQKYPAWEYRYQSPKVIIIHGVDDAPNAASIGPVIYLSHSLVRLMNDRELTAVLAHEWAHSENSHLLKRVPTPLGALFYELAKQIFSGGADHKEAMSYYAKIKQTIDDVNTAMEVQADCFAAKQLAFMHKNGLPNEPLDLNRASNRLYGFEVVDGDADDPATMRARAIRAQFYLQSCEIK